MLLTMDYHAIMTINKMLKLFNNVYCEAISNVMLDRNRGNIQYLFFLWYIKSKVSYYVIAPCFFSCNFYCAFVSKIISTLDCNYGSVSLDTFFEYWVLRTNNMIWEPHPRPLKMSHELWHVIMFWKSHRTRRENFYSSTWIEIKCVSHP